MRIRFRKISITSTLALILALAMIIGIVSNLIQPFDIKATCSVLIGCLVIWYLKPIYLKWVKGLSETAISRMLTVIFIAMMVIQLLVIHFLPASVYHDPFRVLVQAEQLSHGNLSWGDSLYFWRFPNNVSLTVLLSYWLKLTNLLQMDTYWGIHLLSLILLDLFIFAILRSVRRLSHQHGAALLAAVFFLISPFAYTYYLQVFYSDLPTLLCLAIVFNVLIGWSSFHRTKKIVAGIGLVLSVIIGEVVKPNLIVLLVAVALVGIWLLIRNRQQLKVIKTPLILIVLGFVLAVPTAAGLKSASHFKNNNQYAFPTAHWIWMSYNPQTKGKYSFSDVQTLSSIQGKQAKQAYLKKALPERLAQLGPLGIVWRWIEKASILLNVSFMPDAYSGGYIAAPKLYQKFELPLSAMGMIVMRIGFALLYAETFFRCLRLWQRRFKSTDDPRIMLTILTALGYIAFHTLLWETESRYGQVMIPLLGILCAIPSLALESERRVRPRTKTEGWLTLGALAVTIAVFVASSPLYSPKGHYVAEQQSQLSLQFDAKKTHICPYDTLSQQVKLNHQARHFSVSLAPAAEFSGTLINEQTHQHYELKRTFNALTLERTLPEGMYRIRLRNDLQRSQSVLITKTISYRLAPYPLEIDQHKHPYWSFVYTFSR
ncbi:hypothetical protein IWT140_00434 [Secundilactobacillus pentosiphilus]|uniref:Glycosyltransferase RgtA/B/C/D-like domain-containing protein n=1 Tax=Secundilactobacillus pentosiphilus TaxID=1714682 RepID=A0A1Z5IMA1_9LACO|nr:hypothetical protein [Secundilactobacillus pentosiphilus]GAX02836.1 hypothetical protein IWT140_00434 [Secundilactobacillus pentosiphilus]